MKIESFNVCRGFDGHYFGMAKVYVADLIVQVDLTSDEAERAFKFAEVDFTGPHERAKSLVRGATKAAA